MNKAILIKAKLTWKGIKYGLFDLNEQFLKCEYDLIETYIWNDLVWLSLEKDGKKGFYNPESGFLYEPKSDFHFHFFQKNGNAYYEFNGKWGVININGNVILPPIYDSIGSVTNLEDSKGYIRAGINGKQGFLNTKGEWLIEPKFDKLRLFKQLSCEAPVCSAMSFSKWGIIDRKGNWVINPQFDHISDFQNISDLENFVALVTNNEKTGIISDKGDIILEPIYDYISPFDNENNLWNVTLNGEEKEFRMPIK